MAPLPCRVNPEPARLVNSAVLLLAVIRLQPIPQLLSISLVATFLGNIKEGRPLVVPEVLGVVTIVKSFRRSSIATVMETR